MLRFRLLGIPFAVAPYFWILSALLGANLTQGSSHGMLLLAVWVVCVFVSIIVHELGHALAARGYGLSPAVSLAGLGGLTSFPGGSLTRSQHLSVVVAGPAAGLALYLVTRVFSHRLDTLGLGAFFDSDTPASLAANSAVSFLLQINLYWTLINLLPVLPLDGGQALRDLLGPRLAGTARVISIACAAAVAIYAATHGRLYMAGLFGFLAYNNAVGNTGALFGGGAGPAGPGRF